MHQPANVGGQLLSLGPREHHAVVERMQKTVLRDPAAPLNQFLVHERDLPSGAAEADAAQLEPEAESLGPRNRGRWRGNGGGQEFSGHLGSSERHKLGGDDRERHTHAACVHGACTHKQPQ